MKILSAILVLVFSLPVLTNRSKNGSDFLSLPKSVEAERAVLGAAVLNRDALLTVLPKLREDDFGVPENRIVYRCIQALIGTGKPPDPVLMYEWLEAQSLLDKAGGIGYVSSLADGIPRTMNVDYYADIVKQKSVLRSLILVCETISDRAQSERDADGIVEDAVAQILSLASDNGGDVRIREWKEAAESAIAEIEEARREPANVLKLRSGIAQLDDMSAGLRRKELALIVGPTSNGKSLLAAEFSTTADDAGYSGLIFSPEMTAENITIRDVAYEADVPFFLTRKTEMLTEGQVDDLKFAAKKERNIAIVDRGITPERVWAMSEARKRSPRGLDFIVVDYDQLVIEAGIDPDDEASFFGHQARFVTQAKEFSKRLDVCFLLVAQLRKMSNSVKEGKKPTLDDVYGASAMRNAPDVVMWVLRDARRFEDKEKYERNAWVYVLKSRNGRTGKVNLDFDPIRLRLRDRQVESEPERQFDPFSSDNDESMREGL